MCWFVITLYILCVNFGILSILRTFSVISSPLPNSKGTSDTLFFLVECTSCKIPAILVSSLPWENPPYCLVLSTAVGKLYWYGRFVSASSHFNCALLQNVDIPTCNLSDYICNNPTTSSALSPYSSPPTSCPVRCPSPWTPCWLRW